MTHRHTTRKWLELVRFEAAHQLRRRSMWFFFGVYVLLLLTQTNGQVADAREREILFHAPLFIAESSLMMSLISMLVIAGIAGNAATRDVQTRMEPLLHAAPIPRAAYLGGRFAGAFVTGVLVLSAVPLAIMLAPHLHPDLTPELVGPFRPLALLQAFVTFILPNVFIATAVLFALSALVRHTTGSYLGAAVVVGLTAMSRPILGDSLGRWDLAQLVNPLGMTSISVMAKTWSPAELNTRLVRFEGLLLWNRLLWIAIALALLAFAYARFRYGGATRKRGRKREETQAIDDTPRTPLVVPHAPRNFAFAGRVRQTLAIARDSLREIFTRWSFLVVPFLLHQLALAFEDLEVRGTPLLPVTGRVLSALAPMLLTKNLFVMLFAGELVWRERDARMQSLSDAAPVPNAVRFLGKLLGLWLLVLALHALVTLTGMFIQMQSDWYDFEPALYLQIVFGLELIGPLVFALLALSVHVVVNQKHVGHLAVVLIALGPLFVAPLIGIEHPLLLATPVARWRWSAFDGLDPFVAQSLWFSAWWAAVTLLIALIAHLFWVRGVALGVRERMRIARARITRRTAGAIGAAASLVLAVGGFVFYNTNLINEYESSADQLQRQVAYERTYGRHRHTPQPQVTATTLHVELHPQRRAAKVRGVHQLRNRTAAPIDTIHVATSRNVETSDITFDRAARLNVRDDAHGHRIYVLTEPLRPGQPLRMSWQVRYRKRGFPAGEISTDVARNGSAVVLHQWIPLLGYQPQRELTDAAARKEHGLPARPVIASLDDVAARSNRQGQDQLDLDVTIGTAADQTPVGPGTLRRAWTRDGRNYARYTAPHVGQGYAVFSANYALEKARWNGIDLEIVHLPTHTRHVPAMLRGMQASLEQYTRRFGPYPHDVLRMIEYRREDGGAHAAHTSIWYSEAFPLLDASSDNRRIDLPFGVVAHEIAHQFQPQPARVEGIALLSESFAWYAALGVIETEFGAEHLQRFLDFMRRDYLTPRARADVPLLRASDWFVAYRKGPFAMYALREYVGQENVDLAWRRLIARSRSGEPPFATSLDLLHELQQVTPASRRPLLSDLLERNTFWELQTTRAVATPLPNGSWRVTLDVTAKKVVVNEKGSETEIAMHDDVELGVFAAKGKPLHRSMHRLRSGTQTITIDVPSRPVRAGVDPRHLLIDVDRQRVERRARGSVTRVTRPPRQPTRAEPFHPGDPLRMQLRPSLNLGCAGEHMKRLFVLALTLTFVLDLAAAGKISFSATVVDPTGGAIPQAQVLLRSGSANRSTVTDANGRFTFDDLAGAESLLIIADGFTPLHVEAADRDRAQFVLEPAPVAEEITVVAPKPEVRTTTATKTDTPLRDVPQAVTVITKEVIKEQTMQGMADVVRYVPGVGIAQGEGNRDTPVFRGNSSTSDFFIDGVRDDVQYFRDLYNVERVEALKGPNAMIFGRGGVGGVLNRVTRQADWEPSRELTIQGGSWNDRRVTGDFGHVVSSRVAARVTGMYQSSESYRDEVRLGRYGINPTLAFTLGENTVLRAGVEVFHDDRTADRGISSFAGRPVATDVSTFFGNADLSNSRADVTVWATSVEHRFSDAMSLRSRLSFGQYDKFYQNVFAGAVDATGTRVNLSAYNNATQRENLFNQTDLVLKHKTGRVRQTILAGLELGRQVTDNFRETGYFGGNSTSVAVPLSNPTFSSGVTFKQSATDADNHGIATVNALYVQDQLELGRVQVIAGMRYDSFRVDFTNQRTAAEFESRDGLFSPRLGLVYKPIEPLSLYASYSLSYQPRAGEQLSSLSLSNQSLDPEEFRSYEVGAKAGIGNLELSAAVYRLHRGNVAVADPANPTASILVDGQRSEGVELGLAGKLTSAWSITGAYAFQDGEILQSLSATARAGARLAQLPRHSASLWNKLDVTSAFSLGLGIIHRGEVFTSTDNTVTLPSFTRVDAAVYYDFSERLRAQINVENVLDTEYYATAHSNNNITPGSPRAVRVSWTTKF